VVSSGDEYPQLSFRTGYEEKTSAGDVYAGALRPCMFAVPGAEDFSLSFEMTGGDLGVPAIQRAVLSAHTRTRP